ncbi:MAG: hypothetical protein AB7N76_09280 [Planctomycetota bacterium]
MSHPVRSEELPAALRTYTGYLRDLSRVGFDASTTKLRLVVNYARKELVTRGLAELFLHRMTREHLIEEVMGGKLSLPAHPLDRMAYTYLLLAELKEAWKLNLRELLTRPELAGGGLDERWRRFCHELVEPYAQDLERLQAWTRDAVAPRAGALVDPGEVFAEGLAVCFGDAPAMAGQAVAAPAATGALAPLAAAVAAVDAPVRADLAVDLSLLALEQSKVAPDAARLEELVGAFAAAGLEPAARAALAAAGGATASAPAPGPATAAVSAPAKPAPSPPTASAAPTAPEQGRLRAEREALAAERAALHAEREALNALQASLAAERAALAVERAALAAERAALGEG